jgi:uncharacterized protein (DUF362 family)
MQKDKATVAISKNPDPEIAVPEAIRLLGGIKKFANRGDVVLIKPNVSFPIPPEHGPDATSPEVISAVTRLFKEGGAGRVVVGEQSVWGCRTRDAFRITGIKEVVEKAGGEVCYFDEAPRLNVKVDQGRVFKELSLPKITREADLIVNLPKMKTSFISHITLGLKNHYGFINFEDRRKFHRMYDLAYAVCDIAKTVKCGLTLIDGIVAMEGQGPHAGTAKKMDLIIAGRDPVAVDAIGAKIMGFNPLNVVSNHPNVEVYVGGVCPGCAPRIPAVPPVNDPTKKYAIILGRRPNIMEDINADEIWAIGKCGIDAAMTLNDRFSKVKNPIVQKIPGCPPLIWWATHTMWNLLKDKGWAEDFPAR